VETVTLFMCILHTIYLELSRHVDQHLQLKTKPISATISFHQHYFDHIFLGRGQSEWPRKSNLKQIPLNG